MSGRCIKKQGLIYKRLLKAGIINESGQFAAGMIKTKPIIGSPVTESGELDLSSTKGT
jgi:hypothetical protein